MIKPDWARKKVAQLAANYHIAYTAEKPTGPGWYWLRPQNKPARIVRVTEKTIASMYGIGGEWACLLLPTEEGR